ncbi:hypothetical protein PF003_g20050 [Phytophthora fragariae]|nr:hypothetical protein PF003_g20050 [Phytophthora fragariae]
MECFLLFTLNAPARSSALGITQVSTSATSRTRTHIGIVELEKCETTIRSPSCMSFQFNHRRLLSRRRLKACSMRGLLSRILRIATHIPTHVFSALCSPCKKTRSGEIPLSDV